MRLTVAVVAVAIVLGSQCNPLPIAVLDDDCAPGVPYILAYTDDAGREQIIDARERTERVCRHVEWDQKDTLYFRCGDSERVYFSVHEPTIENLLLCQNWE